MSQLRNGKETPGDARHPEGSAASSDADLVRSARRGDKRAFVEIVARHQAMVCGIAFGILNDFAASEDAAQEAFLTAWRKFHDLREPERLRSWLAQIARNAALGHLRRQRGHDPLEHAEALADESPAPDEAAASGEEMALLLQSLAKLPENYRLPLILFYRDGQSVRAVAEALDISEDAVKQRLSRGREMLRDRMSGLVETVLTRTRPTAIFTMTIAVAIGALAAPAAVAGTVFATATATSASASAASSAPILTAMSTSKTFLITTALVTAVCIPVGYHLAFGFHPATKTAPAPQTELVPATPPPESAPAFEGSALFAEWRELHQKFGTNAEAMPQLYQAINELKDPFRKRAFRSALISEWVQVDAAGGLKFILGKGPDAGQRRQFFEEWLALDARAAVDALLSSGTGWESVARDCLKEIARRDPSRLVEIVDRLPKSDRYRDTAISDAVELAAAGNLASTRAAVEAMTGPNRDQALAGVAQAWAKIDFNAAVAWAKALPSDANREEILRAALVGMAAINPVAALEAVELVPPGGRSSHFADTTGARVLVNAAKTDYDATVAWLTAHPGRFSHDDLMGLAEQVTTRLNADPAGFLTTSQDSGAMASILPAIESALLNGSGGRRKAVWEWLKSQPDSPSINSLRDEVLSSAAWQDPDLAINLVADLPRNALGDRQVKVVADRMLNGGDRLRSFDRLYAQVPERLRQPLLESAFDCLGNNLEMSDPQNWIARLPLLPESSRARGIESIARAWAIKTPEEAIQWAASLRPGDSRNGAQAAIVSRWAAKDPHGAATWVSSVAPGPERDHSAFTLAMAISETYPREAWDWALGIKDNDGERNLAATHAVIGMAARDPETARHWIETGPLPPETREKLLATIQRPNQSRAVP